MRNGPLWRSCR
uniref:Cyclin-D1-1 n=1 Tax=Rhizophora mucronata TaxID=61149 RepID=A0A2P2IZP1_RHIMU